MMREDPHEPTWKEKLCMDSQGRVPFERCFSRAPDSALQLLFVVILNILKGTLSENYFPCNTPDTSPLVLLLSDIPVR